MRRLSCIIFIVVIVVLYIILSVERIGVGSFPTAEYRILLVSEDGSPFAGAILNVIDSSGHKSYNYPVVNYQPNIPLVSDACGVVTLQHIDLGPEFALRRRGILPRFV